jgi:hypothetical protein
MTRSAFERGRWRGGRYACDTPDNYGLPERSEATFAYFFQLNFLQHVAGESRFNSHSLTASPANASSSLQTALS